MTYQQSNAVYALNSYLWKALKVNLGWDEIAGTGRPLIPASQQPELMELNRPFIVYSSVQEPSRDLYVLKNEQVVYVIYSTEIPELQETANLLVDLFDRWDDSADDVNEWLAKEKVGGGPDRRIHFKFTRVLSADKDEPSESEGGFYSAVVSVSTQYTSESNFVSNGFTYP